MIENYILKHKNNTILKFSLDIKDFEVTNIIDIIDENRLPFVINNQNKEVSCMLNLNKWLDKRGLTEGRDNYINILFETGASSGKELSINSLGLNLTDHYWLHKEKFNLNWEKLNFFDNKFKDVVLKSVLNNDEDTSNIHPDFSVDGRLIKKWVCYNDERVLMKEGSTRDMQEPFNELIASNIMDRYNINHVKYSVKKIKKRIVSVCNCMADKNTELIPARYVFDKGGKIQDNPYNHFIKVCSDNGINDVRKNLDEMIILDFIIGNEDRHKRNFGILRNPDTLEWLGFAPIFDNGNSLCFRHGANMENLEKRIESFCKWFEIGNLKNLTYIDPSNWYNNKYDNNIIDIIAEGLKNNIDDKKLDKILIIVKDRIDIAEKIINERTNIVINGFTAQETSSLTFEQQLELARRQGYVQGVCECVAIVGNEHQLGKKMLSEMQVTKDMAQKFANPQTYKTLEKGIFAEKQEQNPELSPKDKPVGGRLVR